MKRLLTTTRKRNFLWRPKNLMWSYIIAFVLGMATGYKFIPNGVLAGIYFTIVGISFIYCLKADVGKFFAWIPFAVYMEVYMRGFIRWVPYLTVQYLFIAGFLIFFLRGVRQKDNHLKGIFFLLLYSFLEIIGSVSAYNPANTRAVLCNSLALMMPVMWASYNNLHPILINKLLSSIKVAAVYLSGIVIVAHLTGSINYGLFSNSEASNGLAPVQLSGYLGTACILFFLSIMNSEERKHRVLNIITLGVTTVIMLLTFSRGGLYFLAGIVAVFLFYNRHKMGQYVKLLALVPVGFILYTIVVDTTGGKIVDRYSQEGTSNRDVLIDIGVQIFLKHPYFGVGTGNYNESIVKENLFHIESGAHNEFIRSAAEHGIFGLLFYWGFFFFLLVDILKRPQPYQQYAMYFLVLFCLIIVHNGLKISVQPLLLMLAVGTPGRTYSPITKNVIKRKQPEPQLA